MKFLKKIIGVDRELISGKYTLINEVKEAAAKGVAIGHFNFSSFDVARAIVLASKELNVPVILGLSEGERDFVGVLEAVKWVEAIKKSTYERVYLNADHTYSLKRVVEAVEAGYDAVIFDGAKLNLEENIMETKKCRDFIDLYNHSTGKNVLLEAELGYIGQSSKILTEVPTGVELTSLEDAKKYTLATKVNLFAPAVGNIHGMLKNVPEPKLDIERIGNIKKETGTPLVLHGASGNTKEEVQEAIRNGVAIVHINTEVRVAYRNALEKHLNENKDEIAPYKYLKLVETDVKNAVIEKLKIFNLLN